MNVADRVFLTATIELAEQGRFTCAPNPTVGCIIVRAGRIIGRGFHMLTGSGHAEVNAIADAGGDVQGATVYVSLEPCAFAGRTPACAETLVAAGVARVVIAAQDPHPKVAGAGINILRAAGIEVSLLTDPDALQSVAGYVSRVTTGYPFVRVKTASSIDGATALASGESQWITGAAAREDVQYWRARSDAIITGVGTVIADNPQLNVRSQAYEHCHQPLRVVLDGHLRTPARARVLNDGAPTMLVHEPGVEVPAELQNDSVEFCALEGGPQNLAALLELLAARGCNEVLVEAGAKVCGSFAKSELWSEWVCYLAPKWLGQDSIGVADFSVSTLANAPRGEVVDLQILGADVRIRIAPVDDREAR